VKTLHLTNSWHASSGGIGTFYKALFETAEREGHYMRLVVPGETTRVDEVGRFGRVYSINSPRAPLNREYRILYPHRFLFPNTAIQRIVNNERPDLIEVSEKYTMHYLAGLLRTRRLPGIGVRPAVVGVSHERMDENFAAYVTCHPFGKRFCDWYMKWLYFPMFDHHITVSEHTAAELIDASRGHEVRRGIWIAPMGVDCDRFTPARKTPEARARLRHCAGADAGTTVLLYAGRLAPEKNLPLLLDTMQALNREALNDRSFRLVIAGEGILLAGLRAECESRNLRNVVFLGHVHDRDKLAEFYANSDIFVHPNPREPFGIAPLEAMAAGLALVAPNGGGVTSYANAENAWLTRPDGNAFANCIRAIRSDTGSTSRKIVEARRTAEEYRWSNVTSHYLRLYRELAAVTQGEQAALTLAARTYSTPGDAFGRELIDL
jgi:alpha-1,6-mannosyltransferase